MPFRVKFLFLVGSLFLTTLTDPNNIFAGCASIFADCVDPEICIGQGLSTQGVANWVSE
jgi:hypothetical protein